MMRKFIETAWDTVALLICVALVCGLWLVVMAQ